MSALPAERRQSSALADEAIVRFAEALAPHLQRVLGREAISSPWLSAGDTASYLRCPVSRVRKLTMTGELPVHRDGRRVLYHRDELDAFVRAGGAICP